MMKNLIKRAILASNSVRLAAKLQRTRVAILLYHSVLDDPSKERNTLGGISHSTQVFRAQMELIARKYNPVNMDDILCFVSGGKDLPSRSVVVTFDDGYADNYEVAFPVLDHLGIPAVFYVTVDCIENAKLPWPSRLRYVFYKTQKTSWTEQNGATWPLQSSEHRERAFLKACDYCCQLGGKIQEEFVTAVERGLEVELPSGSKHPMMTWDQVCGLMSKGHTIGSHTMTHPNMAYVAEPELYDEFLNSKCRLEQVLNSPAVHFAYPCPALSPHWAKRTIKVSRHVGYQTAVTANLGAVRRGDDPLCLRRALPTREVDGLRWNLELAFAGRTA